MTVSEMQIALRLHLDKSTSLTGSVDFLSEELNFWLNESQDRFIKQRMFGNNYYKLGFEQSQKRIDDLRNLVILGGPYSLTTSSLGSNVKEGALPVSDVTSPYLYYIDSSVYNSSSLQLNAGKVLQEMYLGDYVKDFINNPYIRRPLVVLYDSKIVFVYSDEFIPTTFDLTYIKKPKTLTTSTPGTYETNTCELAEHTHREIVALAASLLIENIESPRVQTFEALNSSKIE
jgi:hypothetical protein